MSTETPPSTNTIVQTMIESGVHFGHRTSLWNPKMAPYIFGRKNQIHILDIRETLRGLLRAKKYLQQVAANNGLILFVGTKRQAGEAVEEHCLRCGMPFVAERWLGGTLVRDVCEYITRPPMLMSPWSAFSSPATHRSVVVFPQPLGPRSVRNSPWFSSRSRSPIAVTAGPRLVPLNTLVNPVTVSISLLDSDVGTELVGDTRHYG